MNATSIAVALIGAVTAITGAFFTAQATSSTQVNTVNGKGDVLEERQSNQYSEVKESLDRIEKKLDSLK